MKQEITIFKHELFGEVRTMMNAQGETFFVGKDVAMALGYKNPSNALQAHVEDDDKTTYLIKVAGSNYKTNTLFINESGLYSLVLSSKLDKAREFKRWVTSVVLPAIRKKGCYDMEPRAIRKMAADAEYCQQVLKSVGCVTTKELANEMGMSVNELTKRLLQAGVIYSYNADYLLYTDWARKHLAQRRTDHDKGRDNESHIVRRLVWTEEGRKAVYEVIERQKLKEKEMDLLEFC